MDSEEFTLSDDISGELPPQQWSIAVRPRKVVRAVEPEESNVTRFGHNALSAFGWARAVPVTETSSR